VLLGFGQRSERPDSTPTSSTPEKRCRRLVSSRRSPRGCCRTVVAQPVQRGRDRVSRPSDRGRRHAHACATGRGAERSKRAACRR
jgi:hypothetical protein